MKHFGKREMIYLCVIASLLLGIQIQKSIIQKQRNKQIISMIGEYAVKGMPVVVRKMVKEDVFLCEKSTLLKEEPDLFYGYVARTVKRKLFKDMPVFTFEGGQRINGRVSFVADEIDRRNGMFLIKVVFERAVSLDRIIASFKIKEYDNVFAVDNDDIEKDKTRSYIWKINSGVAEKVEIRIKDRDRDISIVDNGIEQGDLLVSDGESLLKPGIKIRIVKERKERLR